MVSLFKKTGDGRKWKKEERGVVSLQLCQSSVPDFSILFKDDKIEQNNSEFKKEEFFLFLKSTFSKGG